MRSGLSDTVGHERVSILSAIRIAVALIAFSRAKQIGCSLSSSASKSQSPTMIAKSLFRSCASVQRSATKGRRIVFFQLATTARPNSTSSATDMSGGLKPHHSKPSLPFGGMKLIARSASAVMVRLGLTPRFAATTAPSQMYTFL
jgi:hypothetical protein